MREAMAVNRMGNTGLFSWAGHGPPVYAGQGQGGQEDGEAGQLQVQFTNLTLGRTWTTCLKTSGGIVQRI